MTDTAVIAVIIALMVLIIVFVAALLWSLRYIVTSRQPAPPPVRKERWSQDNLEKLECAQFALRRYRNELVEISKFLDNAEGHISSLTNGGPHGDQKRVKGTYK